MLRWRSWPPPPRISSTSPSDAPPLRCYHRRRSPMPSIEAWSRARSWLAIFRKPPPSLIMSSLFRTAICRRSTRNNQQTRRNDDHLAPQKTHYPLPLPRRSPHHLLHGLIVCSLPLTLPHLSQITQSLAVLGDCRYLDRSHSPLRYGVPERGGLHIRPQLQSLAGKNHS